MSDKQWGWKELTFIAVGSFLGFMAAYACIFMVAFLIGFLIGLNSIM